MKTLEQALADALNARRDPLADDDVLAALVSEPERFAEVARLSDRLAHVASVARPARRVVPIAVAATAAALLIAGGLWWSHVDTHNQRHGEAVAVPDAPRGIGPSETNESRGDDVLCADLPYVHGRERIASLVLSLEESSQARSEITTLRIDANGERKLERRATRLTPKTDYLTLSTEQRYP